MGRKKSHAARWRWLTALVLLAALAGGWGWWQLIHWQPDRAAFPVQGVLVGAQDGAVDFRALKAIGADFVYLDASDGARRRDPDFGANLAAAKRAGLPYGVVHSYDPCLPAERQSANFVTIVPRDKALLPPAIALDRLAEGCSPKVGDAEVESELMTFLNQVEGHVGKPALLMIAPEFERRYHFASAFDRNLWVTGIWRQPIYAGRPWTLWTANTMLRTPAADEPLRWVALQP